MKHIIIFVAAIITCCICSAQNVGIGTTTPTEKLHVVGNRALFETNYFGIGVGNPATGFTSFQINSNINNYLGMYINSGTTGIPFYGYALNGIAKSYTSFNSGTNQFEYHQTSDATPDFFINGNTKAVFNTGFVGIGTSTPTTGFTGFAMKNNVNTFYGQYVDAGVTGVPFYGYALNGTAVAYTTYNGGTSRFEYHHTSDAVPDFYVSNTDAVFPNTNFLGIGTTTPTTGFTGFAMKSNVNNFYGSYIDAGATGIPFYGYALNGVAKAYTGFSGTNNQFEYHQTSDAIPDFLVNGNTKAVFNTAFVGIGTSTPTTGFTGFAMKNNVNNFYGSYIDAGPTGVPFYGYALNGVAKAYTTFNGNTDQFEYHHTSDAIADFSLSNTQASFPNATIMTLGTNTPFNGSTAFTIKNLAATGFWGMYIEAGSTGNPFYGYAVNGSVKAYTQINGSNNNWELITGTTALSITPGGSVGMGTTAPTAKLSVNGTANNTSGSWGVFSDARVKTVEEDFDDGLNIIKQMHTVRFTYNENAPFNAEGKQIGIVAQELEKIAPYMVSQKKVGQFEDLREVNNQAYVFLLINAVKDQQKQIESEKKENEDLKSEMQMLLKRVEKLEADKK